MLNHSGLAWRTATLPPSYTLLIYSVWQIKSFLLHRLQSTACSTMSSSKGCRGMLSPSWRNFSCFAFDTFAHFISFSSSCVVFSLLSYMQVPRDAPNEADELCCSPWWICSWGCWHWLSPAWGSSSHLPTEASPAGPCFQTLYSISIHLAIDSKIF